VSDATLDRDVRVVAAGYGDSLRFRVVVAVYSAAIAAAAVFAAVTGSDADWVPVLLLAALFVLAEHRDRVFTDETGLSGSIAVALSAAYFVASDGWVGGAFIVGAAGGLYVPHLHHRAFSKIIVNSASFGLSSLAAAASVFVMTERSSSALAIAMSVVLATAVYWLINSLLLAVATSALSREPVLGDVAQLVRSDTVMLVFGLGGAICGVVMTEVGTWTGIATLVALLVALDVFVISVPAGLTVVRSAWAVVLARGMSGGVAGTVGAYVTLAVSISALGAIAGLAAGMAAGVVVVVLILGARLIVIRRRIDPVLVGGLVVIEVAFPAIAATAGVVTSLAGLRAGLVVASALVVAGSVAVAVRRRRSKAEQPVIEDDTLMAAVVEAMLDGLPSPTRDR
jgi:hypothetical protein